MFSCKLPPSLVPSSRSEVLVKISRFWLRLVEFFLRFTTTVGNLGREKIDFIGVAPLRVTKTSFDIVAHK